MDGNKRSIVKAISWRISGTIDTIFIAFLLTAKIGNALRIGGIEVITKMVLYYLHERVWNTITWGLKGSGSEEYTIRSIGKAITWRLTATFDTILISYIITGQIMTAINIGLLEWASKLFLYYMHERIWNTIKWGKETKVSV